MNVGDRPMADSDLRRTSKGELAVGDVMPLPPGDGS